MKKTFSNLNLAALAFAGGICVAQSAPAQVAGGTTTVGINVIESTQITAGWSVKKTLMGKAIYNDEGQKVGKVQDLIISPDKKLSYVIVVAGGILGMGRHDVAFPTSQIEDKAGQLLLAGVTKDMVKGMPKFAYASATFDTTKREAFVAARDRDSAKGKAKLAELKKKAGTAASDARAKINAEMTTVQADVKTRTC